MADEVKYKVAEDFKATVTLPSGKEVTVDLMKINAAEWKQAVRAGTKEDEEYEIISKATGLPVEELGKMIQPDYRVLVDTFVRVGMQPLTNPT